MRYGCDSRPMNVPWRLGGPRPHISRSSSCKGRGAIFMECEALWGFVGNHIYSACQKTSQYLLLQFRSGSHPPPLNPCPKLSFTHFPDRKLWEVNQSWCVLWNVVLRCSDHSSAHQDRVGADADDDLGHLVPSSSAALGSCTGRSQHSPHWWGTLKL